MRRAPLLITALCAVMMTGCVLSGKPGKVATATPAVPKTTPAASPTTPSEPLSIPQTDVELPKPQPLDPAALAPAVPAQAETTQETQSNTRTNAGRRTGPATPPPTTNPSVPPLPSSATPHEPSLPPIREVVSATEMKRFQDQAQGRRKEVQQILEQLSHRRLTRPQQNVVTNIHSFVNASAEAERKGDMREADALAERAQILARNLLNGK